MPDITKCSGEHCKRRDKCYRHTAPSSDHQSWFGKPPVDRKDGHCEYVWPVQGWEPTPKKDDDAEVE